MMYGMIYSSIYVREYLVLLAGFILLDIFSCGITYGGLFILIFFNLEYGMVCSVFVSSTLGGRVSTLGGGVVCSFIGLFCFYFVCEKLSDNFYNSSI